MIFLDSGDINEIRKFLGMGIIRGVTTNPTIMKRDGITDIDTAIKEIGNCIYPYPLSIEVTSNNYPEMMEQAIHFTSINSDVYDVFGFEEDMVNINVKIPIHGPNGEMDYLNVISDLTDEGIEVNATAIMSTQQLLLAAMAGARYVSLFGGRVNNMGYNAIGQIKQMRKLIDRFDLDTELIIGSVREAINVTEWLVHGADIVTVPPKILDSMIVHPYTKETVQQFLDDAKEE